MDEQISTKKLWENHYTKSKYYFQLSYFFFTICLWVAHFRHSLQVNTTITLILISFIISQLLVDFLSGLLHWACDTWGRFETPLLGPTLIRTFRMHHVDPQDITKHGFIETNASSCYSTTPFLIVGLIIPTGCCLAAQIYHWVINFSVILAIITNEIHKWAHMLHSKPNKIIEFLQKSRLILSHDHHHVHHQNNFDGNYCIINGWMNPLLEKIKFWRKLQAVIAKITGIQPRCDDNFWRDVKKT